MSVITRAGSSPAFGTKKSNMNYLKQILKLLKPYRHLIIFSVLLSLLFATANVFIMPLIRDITREVANKNLVYFNNHMINAFLLFSIRTVSKSGNFYLMSKLNFLVMFDLRNLLFHKFQKLSLSYYTKNKTGDILTKLFIDVEKIKEALLLNLEHTLPNVLTIIAVIIYLFIIDWKLTILSISTIPFYILITSYFGEKIKKISKQAQRKMASITHIASESIANILVVKAFTMENHEIKKFKKENKKNYQANLMTARFNATMEPLISFLQFTLLAAIIWFGGYQIAKNNLSGPILISYFTGIFLLVEPIMLLAKVYTTTQSSLASAERIFKVLEEKETITNSKNARKLSSVQGNITFQNVSFFYDDDPDTKILDNINLETKKGEIVALVGLSGAGKSTFINLIPRFYDPSKGTIFLDGQDIKKTDLQSLRSQISIVPQESLLFRGTIKENISYGKIKASEKAIINAAKEANAWEFIEQMPGKLKSTIGDRGQKLSGGQRQRIAIARAIINNPKILILDEATSSLDSKSEKLVQEALQKLMQNRTTFVIAHRLSTIRNAHKIVFIEKGKIKEIGTHTELLKNDSHYAKLCELQFK
jgi:ATP-binding cassette, subfamily B, bacterial MsbA